LQLTLKATNGEAGLVLAAAPTPSVTTTGTASASIASSPASPAAACSRRPMQSFVWTYSVAGTEPFLHDLGFRHRRQRRHHRVCAGCDRRARHRAEAGEHRDRFRERTPSLVYLGEPSTSRCHAQRRRGRGAPVQLSGVSASATAVQSGPLPAAQTVPGNGSAVFHIAFTAQSEGTFTLTAGATGTEANVELSSARPPSPRRRSTSPPSTW